MLFTGLGRVTDVSSIDQALFVDPIGSPFAVLVGLYPANTYNRIVFESGVAEVIVHMGFVERKAVAPNIGVWKARTVRGGIGLSKDFAHPVDVFAIRNIRHLDFVHVKAGNSRVFGRIVRIQGDGLLGCTHDKGSTGYKDHPGRGRSIVVDAFESQAIRVTVFPGGGGGALVHQPATVKQKGQGRNSAEI